MCVIKMKGIILHGGHGTRLRPLTHTGPKQLLPIANKPMSQYCIESIKEAGITDIAIIIGGLGANKVRDYYGNGENFGVNITYIEQDEPRGIAHAIRLCKEFVNNEKFLVFLGDNIIQKPITDFVENFSKSDYDATVLLCEVDNPSRFGIADVKNENIVKMILGIMGKSEDLIEYVEDRPGHDFRYSMDSSKISKELNWKQKISFKEGVEKTVEWYLNHEELWKDLPPKILDPTPWKN